MGWRISAGRLAIHYQSLTCHFADGMLTRRNDATQTALESRGYQRRVVVFEMVGLLGHRLVLRCRMQHHRARVLRDLRPGFMQLRLKYRPEGTQYGQPGRFPSSHAIQLRFEVGGVAVVKYLWKHAGDIITQRITGIGRGEGLVLALHIAAILNDLHHAGVGRGPPDAALLQRMDELRRRVAMRRVILAVGATCSDLAVRVALQNAPRRHVGILLPPLVDIEGGTYPIGSDEGRYDDESHAHTVIW
jgi:hypothetical protein